MLHGRLILNTERLPTSSAELRFGFMFAKNNDKSFYDGLQVVTKLDTENLFVPMDITSTEPFRIHDTPDVFTVDKLADWVIRDEESTSVCDERDKCEFSVVFVRNLSTGDVDSDIAFEIGEELQYALTGFYRAQTIDERITHIGQSHDMIVLMGAVTATTVSTFAAISALIAMSTF